MTHDRKMSAHDRAKDAGSRIRSYVPLAPAIIAALLLSLEYGLQKAGHGGMCPTAGCAVVGTFVKYGEIMFIGLGVIFFWILTGLLYLGKRLDKPWLWTLVSVILTTGLAFDGGILGFQRFGIQEACVLCYTVGASLLLILAAFGWMHRSVAVVAMGIAVWSAGFASQAFFAFPEKTPDLRQAVLTTFRPAQPNGVQIFYFFSLHCPQCSGVLASLAAHPPQGGDWHLIALDTKPDDQRMLSALLDHPLAAINPFSAILVLKNAPAPDVDILPKTAEAAHKGGVFMRNSGFRNMPLMVVQETPTRRVVLEGRDPILNYLMENGLVASRLFF